MFRPFAAIVGMVLLLSTQAGIAAGADVPSPAPTLADAIRGGWVTDIEGVRHIFILKVSDAVVSGIYCDVDCSDPAHLSLIEHGSLTADGVRFQIHPLDGGSERADVVGRLTDNRLVLTAKGARQWTLQRDPRKPAVVTVEELFARRGITSGPLVISGSPNPYTPPGPNESLTPSAVEGLWVWSTGPAKQHFIFRRVGQQILGVVCGPCDNPYTFGVIDNVAIRGDTLTFDINHQDWGIGIEFGPFANHARATVSHHEMHLHSVQHNGSRTIEGDMVLIGPLRQISR
jgi:hypothetical protein